MKIGQKYQDVSFLVVTLHSVKGFKGVNGFPAFVRKTKTSWFLAVHASDVYGTKAGLV